MIKNKQIKFLNVEKSFIDKTKKYIFKLHDGLIMETTYIDNGSNKDIICVSCQTMCSMRCKFCHLTDLLGKIKIRNITSNEIEEGVNYVHRDMNLSSNNRPLLVSYMGSGEAVLNVDECVKSMINIRNNIKNVRFGMATIIPKNSIKEFDKLTNLVYANSIDLKLHLSLHFTDDKTRKEWMPNALNIKDSISKLDSYNNITGNNVEIHYTLIEGANDSEEQINTLSNLVKDKDINIKFLHYKKRSIIENNSKDEDFTNILIDKLNNKGIQSEFYNPPGEDIGSSCGQFLLEKY